MTLDEYRVAAMRTARQIDSRQRWVLNAALGLGGEAGEVLEHVKKVEFHGHELNADYLVEEVGDALWYIAQMSVALDVSLEEIARRNIAKLQSRYPGGFSEEASRNAKRNDASDPATPYTVTCHQDCAACHLPLDCPATPRKEGES